MIKNKRGELFGMSFNMIFSIILIIFFLMAAFYGIKAFLNYQENITLNLFVRDLQNEIDEAWRSERTLLTFNSTLPVKINYVCLASFAIEPVGTNNIEASLYDDLKKDGYSTQTNLYLYSTTRGIIKSATLKHVDFKIKNPICFRVINSKVNMKIEKKSDNPLVLVGY